MEKTLKIKISPENYLYGKFQGSLTRPLFIVLHGMPGSMDEEFYRKATEFFWKRGFSTFRFNFYGGERDSRQLMDCTLETHAHDLDVVVRHFRKKGTKRIFVAGHSFGGLVTLLSEEQRFDAAVLWDPSYKISFTRGNYGVPAARYVRELNGYLTREGVNYIVGKAMVGTLDNLKWDRLTENFNVPLKLVLAGNNVLKKARNYLKAVKGKKDVVIIPGATHYFNDRKGMQEKIFRISEAWFRKFL